MDLNLLRGIMIVLLLISFAGIAIWLWFFADHSKLEQAARMPLEDDRGPGVLPAPHSVQESAR